MPQPLSRVVPKIEFFTVSADVFSEKPELAIAVAKSIALSSNIDHELGLLLSRILKTDTGPALAIFSRLQTMQLQKAALVAAATAALDRDAYRYFSAALASAETAQKARNKLAHWVWGSCNELPDALILIDPEHLQRRMMAADKWKRRESGDVSSLSFDLSRFYVYTKDDFDTIIRDLAESLRILNFFVCYLSPQYNDDFIGPYHVGHTDAPQTRAESLRRLSTQRLFREALARFDAKENNNR